MSVCSFASWRSTTLCWPSRVATEANQQPAPSQSISRLRIENFPHFVSQFDWREGLLKKGRPLFDSLLKNEILRLPRHEQHFHAGPNGRGALSEIPSSEFRHHNIAKQKIDWTLMRLAQGQALQPVASFEDDISARLQDSSREVSDH